MPDSFNLASIYSIRCYCCMEEFTIAEFLKHQPQFSPIGMESLSPLKNRSNSRKVGAIRGEFNKGPNLFENVPRTQRESEIWDGDCSTETRIRKSQIGNHRPSFISSVDYTQLF